MRVEDVSSRYTYLTVEHTSDKFVTNNQSQRKRVLSEIKQALIDADSFDSAVAFITKSGVVSLLQALYDFTERGGKARIVASDYLSFTQPAALKMLLAIPAVEVRLLQGAQYHGKLFLFKNPGITKVLVGSSNITQTALSRNDEINFLFSQGEERVNQANQQFERIWRNATVLNKHILEEYSQQYKANKKNSLEGVVQLSSFTPNELQKQALEKLRQSRILGKQRGLVVSATGTGKTVLSAFDVRQSKAKSALFLVHRTTIAKKSMETYQTILKDEYSFGLVGGQTTDWDADFLFGTVQTISRPENLSRLAKTRFAYIVIDETHRASAASYQRIIEHFQPEFLLGMTATPERSDNQNIFDIFDNNIVCDIRLQDALETDILCPFHYFGIADLSHESDKDITLELLTREQRFRHIYNHSLKFGADKLSIKALCFLSRVEEAKSFTEFLKQNGEKAIALTGSSSEKDKQDAIDSLENGNLSYIITVDIFNEGVDIPSINQIIMARPTQSAIIFVQQLGRGLRKHHNKEYLTVIDIVGNYTNNFLIPIALYGDRSRNKDNLRRLLRSEETLLPGESTISFDRIAKERIFKAIQTSPNIGIRELKTEYNLVKSKTGTFPSLMSMRMHGDLSSLLFCKQSNIKSIHEFACKYDPEYQKSEYGQMNFPLLGLLINEALDGIQAYEPLALNLLLNTNKIDFKALEAECEARFGLSLSFEKYLSIINVLNLRYGSPQGHENHEVIDTHSYSAGSAILALSSFQKELLCDAIENAIAEYTARREIGRYVDGFIVGAKYSYKETFRILGWRKNRNPQNVGGYFYDRETNDCAIFVNYHKNDGIAETTQYNDYFINPSRFHWTTKNNRSLSSPEVLALLDQENNKLRVPLFIRKEAESEGSARYYIGELRVIKGTQTLTTIGGKKAVSIEFELDQPIPQKLYQHLVHKY